jgi:hypothetical protein
LNPSPQLWIKAKAEKRKEQKLRRSEEEKRLGERVEQELARVIKKNKETHGQKHEELKEEKSKDQKRNGVEVVQKAARAEEEAKAPALKAWSAVRSCIKLLAVFIVSSH